MIIAIDGPAASGKSTVARVLAARLELLFLNTGAMYRAVGVECARRHVDLEDGPACGALAAELAPAIDFDEQGLIQVGGQSWAQRVEGESAGAQASAVALHVEVRAPLVERQRAIGRIRGVVAEGRDTTTVVFPEADHKFFLWASAAERGRRRAAQEGRPELAEAYAAELEARDAQDSARPVAPLIEAEDAVRVETDELEIEAVVELLLEHVHGRPGGAEHGQ